MVENPASSLGADPASKVADREANTQRLQELASKGAADPASLGGAEVKELCDAVISHLGGASAA